MKKHLRSTVTTTLSAAFTLLALTACQIQPDSEADPAADADFPTEPIELVVPYGPGGPTDTLARVLAQATSEDLGEGEMVVLNQPGGGGTIGTTEVFNANPDGYTLGFIAGGPLGVQPHYGETSYAYDDLQPVARVAVEPIVLAVQADAPWETFDDFIAYLKEPDSSFDYASTGAGNPANIAMEKFNTAAGVSTTQVPFEGGSEALTALLGGNVDGAAGSASSFRSAVESGDVRFLINLGSVKGDFYEDVPTLQEEGIDAATDINFGVIAPEELPAARLDQLSSAIETALQDQETIDRLNDLGVVPGFAGPEEYEEIIAEEYESNGVILQDLGLIK